MAFSFQAIESYIIIVFNNSTRMKTSIITSMRRSSSIRKNLMVFQSIFSLTFSVIHCLTSEGKREFVISLISQGQWSGCSQWYSTWIVPSVMTCLMILTVQPILIEDFIVIRVFLGRIASSSLLLLPWSLSTEDKTLIVSIVLVHDHTNRRWCELAKLWEWASR